MENNCYILYDENKKAVCIDPGFDMHSIKNQIEKFQLNLEKIILTHGHFDHISAAAKLSEATKAEVVAHKDEKEVIETEGARMRLHYSVPQNITYIDEGEITCGDMTLKVIHTPGHTKGGICLYIDKYLFSGDTIFKKYIGRCDLPTGDIKKITNSIINKLFSLPDDTIIYPGHNEATTIEQEKKHNEVFRWL